MQTSRSIVTMRTAALLALLTATGGGCVAHQAYQGPKRPDVEIAIVTGESRVLFARNEYVRIIAIDGARTVGEWRGGALRADVLPGEHIFSVSRDTQYMSGGLFATFAQFDQGELPINLAFPVEAGRRYTIELARDGSGTYIVTRSPMDGSGSAEARAECAPRKPFDYLHLVCPFP